MNTDRSKLKKQLPLMLTALLFAVLMLLTAVLIGMISGSLRSSLNLPRGMNKSAVPGDPGLADARAAMTPGFIGISRPGSRKCIVGNSNVSYSIYSELCVYLADYLSAEQIDEITSSTWTGYVTEENSVFLRFHSEYPDLAISSLADLVTGKENSRSTVGAYIYEMVLIPGTESSEMSRLAVRSLDGRCREYILGEQSEKLTSEAISRITGAYSFLDLSFVFACEDDSFSNLNPTEPVIIDPVITKNIIMTDNTAQFLMQKSADISRLMQFFSMNPDKLLNSRSDPSVSMVSDRTGVLRVYPSSIEFQAADDAAPDISLIIGNTEEIGIPEYTRAAYSLISSVRSLGSMYTGGDCEIRLAGISSADGQTELTFDYCFDNIKISGIGHAVTVVFSRAKLVSFELFTISVKGLGAFSEAFSEWWFDDIALKDRGNIGAVNLVYKGDFVRESLSAEWSASLK
ncbi:MAG: hypothetical protein IJU57_01340 [Clostridia bacterium]|nr:hypothetical protein [Clostridia bacterium]